MTYRLQLEENHYTLELTTTDDVGSKMIVYARGISPSLMKLKYSETFRITKYCLRGHEYISKNLTRGFLTLQKAIRKRQLYRKRAHRLLRQRETNLITTDQFLLKMNRP